MYQKLFQVSSFFSLSAFSEHCQRISMQRIAIPFVFFCLFLLTPLFCAGQEPAAPDTKTQAREARMEPCWLPLIARLAEDGMDKERMTQLFSDLALPWSPVFMATAVQERYGTRLGADAQVKALPDKELPRPRDYLPPAANGFEGAKAMLRDRAPLLAEVQKRYGIPPSLIAAILLLESDMGHELGEGLALHALASMAVTNTLEQALQGIAGYQDPQPALRREMEKSIREKSALAYKELQAFIIYCETGGIDMLRLPGSVYGAIGLCQFMPGNINVYGVDSDKKGIVDLFSLPDAAYSIGNLLKEHGFSEKLSIKKQVGVLRRYNQSESYAALVLGMSYQLTGRQPPAELGIFAATGGRKAWWPKVYPAYRLPPLGNYRTN
jgi:membrane-bound lytic murein transglycosylase B